MVYGISYVGQHFANRSQAPGAVLIPQEGTDPATSVCVLQYRSPARFRVSHSLSLSPTAIQLSFVKAEVNPAIAT